MPYLLNLLILAALSVASSHAAEVVIRNGGMTQGDAVPLDWTGREGGATSARDTAVFKEGPASLRIEVTGKGGRAFQKITGVAGQSLKLAGWVKSSGDVKAQVAIHAFAAGFKQNQFLQVKYVQGETEWAAFEKEVKVPEWAAWITVVLMAEGSGKAWLDEVRIAGQSVDPGQPLTSEQVAETKRPRDPAKDEPDDGKPWEPGWCIHGWRGAWVGQHKQFVESAKKGEGDIIFLGDSITLGWKERWKDTFAPLKAVNLGIGGDSTRQTLWRIQHGELDGRKAKLVVIAIGTNNLYGDKNKGSDGEIAKGIEAVVKLVREKQPQAKILLCAILPRQNEYFSTRIKKINAQTVKLADGKDIHWLDMREVFMEKEPGTMKANLFVEKGGSALHPNDAGYDAMTAVMKPIIAGLLK